MGEHLLHIWGGGWHPDVVGLPPPLDLVKALHAESENSDHDASNDDNPLDGQDSQANDRCHFVCLGLLSMASSEVNNDGVITEVYY